MTYVEIAASLRAAIKAAGFKARVHVLAGGGAVSVGPLGAGNYFTADQIGAFCTAAKAIGLTFIRNTPIDVAAERNLTGCQRWEFHKAA
jgi:hypothetical protein